MFCQVLQERLITTLLYVQYLSDLHDHQVRICNRSKRDKANTILEVINQVSSNLHGETGLACASWAYKGEQRYVVVYQQSSCSVQFLFTSDQGRALQWQ